MINSSIHLLNVKHGTKENSAAREQLLILDSIRKNRERLIIRNTVTCVGEGNNESGKTERERNERKSSKKTGAGRFGMRSKEDPGVLDRDADQES
ncbi:UNVERIFIED_CONTAM: hypothetical protein NCL1_20082 [Trichonephila clavipes]